MTIMHVDSARLLNVCQVLMGGSVSYKLGAKAGVKKDMNTITTIDCSGFTRYVLYHATGGKLNLVGGSVMQKSAMEKSKYKSVVYATAASSDWTLRIAFIPNNKNGVFRHVWLVLNGKTLESRGGKGPSMRAWNSPKLNTNVSGCFQIATLSKPKDQALMTWFQSYAVK